MLVLLTDRKTHHAPLKEALWNLGVYFFEAPLEIGAFICEQKDTGGVILDCIPDLKAGEKLCSFLRATYPQMPIAVILKQTDIPNLPADRILREDKEKSILEDAIDFCRHCGWSEHPMSVYHLSVGKYPNNTYYMGYPLSLSPLEHEVLRCLFYRSPRLTSADDLLTLCFHGSPVSIRNVAVVISEINRKAKQIDERPLIINHYGKGYRLRKSIV